MTAYAPAPRWSSTSLALLAAAIFAGIVAAGYAALSRIDAPDYGAWTGIRPLETKLRLLEEFAAAGPVDALALGSSITEFGFHAQYFSEVMSQRLGRPYRAFNFASGGAEPRTLPKLYRLARTVSRPKSVLVIMPPEPKLQNRIYAGSPDIVLATAPVATVLNHPWLLDFNRRLWNTQLLRNAPAIRDLLLFREYRNLAQAVGMESYALSPHGDRVSYLVTFRAGDLAAAKKSGEAGIPLHPRRASNPSLEEMLDHHFARIDIDAIEELKQLVKADGGKLVLVSHDAAAGLWEGVATDARFLAARQDFFGTFARKLEAEFIDAAALIDVPTYAVSDVTHLNVHGSLPYTRVLAALMTGEGPGVAQGLRTARLEVPALDYYPGPDKTFNQFAALAMRPAGRAHPLLKFRTIDSLAVPKLPNQDGLFVGLRLPDNSDVMARAVPIGNGDFIAEVDLPAAQRPQGIVLRVLLGDGEEKIALSNPIEDYEWLESYPRTPMRRPDAQQLEALALPPTRTPGDTLYVAVKSQPMPPSMALRLQPRGGASARPLELQPVAATGTLLKATLPKRAAHGDYDLQVVDTATGKVIAQAPALTLKEPEQAFEPAQLRVVGTPAVAEGAVRAAFRNIVRPHPQDWVGLFPESGKPDSRLEMAFTGAREEGEVLVRLSPQVSAAISSATTYVLRLHAAGGWLRLAQSEPFRFDISPREATLPPGTPRPLLASERNPAIATGSVKVTWSRIMRPMPKDWIGLFPADGRAEDRIELAFTDGRQEGEAAFPIRPAMAERLAQGEYEFRLYAHGSWDLLARSAKFRFQAPPAHLAAAAASQAGEKKATPARVPGPATVALAARASLAEPAIKVKWSGIGDASSDDWIGLFPAGGKPEERLDFVFVKGAAQGEMAFPISTALTEKLKRGDYELRIYKGWNLVARSETFSFARN